MLGLLNFAEPAIASELGHAFSAIVAILLTLGFFLYMLYKSKSRKGKYKYYPLIFSTLALILMPIIPVWKTGADIGWFPDSAIWITNCSEQSNWLQTKCLSTGGWIATSIGTWLGNVCLLISMVW